LWLKRAFIPGLLFCNQTTGIVGYPKERNAMKKLMTLMLGLTIAISTVAVSFAQEPTKKEGKKKGGKKGGKKKSDGEKKGGL
jgi:hypothetical protein